MLMTAHIRRRKEGKVGGRGIYVSGGKSGGPARIADCGVSLGLFDGSSVVF